MIQQLSPDVIKHAKPPDPPRREYFLRDDQVLGLGVRVTAMGTKSFVLECRIRRKSRRLTLGHWPDMGLLAARKLALIMRGEIAKGEDPHAARQAARRRATTGEQSSE